MPRVDYFDDRAAAGEQPRAVGDRRHECAVDACAIERWRLRVIAVLDEQQDDVVALCRRFGVRRLDVFGSAVTGAFDAARSDVDFLVELDPPSGMSRFDAFFGLKESLERLLGRRVDLVDPSALDNPYFAAAVETSRQALYAE